MTSLWKSTKALPRPGARPGGELAAPLGHGSVGGHGAHRPPKLERPRAVRRRCRPRGRRPGRGITTHHATRAEMPGGKAPGTKASSAASSTGRRPVWELRCTVGDQPPDMPMRSQSSGAPRRFASTRRPATIFRRPPAPSRARRSPRSPRVPRLRQPRRRSRPLVEECDLGTPAAARSSALAQAQSLLVTITCALAAATA